MNKTKLKLSILIPVYNEEKTISQVLKKVLAVSLPQFKKELIIVNDGSSDKTEKYIHNFIQKSDANIKIYKHEINHGKGAAIRTCIQKATGDILIIQDGDLELDPSDYKTILKPIEEKISNVVFGSRFIGKRHAKIPPHTLFGNIILTKLTNILYGANLTDMATAYKAFTKDSLKGTKLKTNKFEIDAELTANLLKNNEKIYEVPIKYFPRTSKEGKKLRLRDGLSIIYVLLKNRVITS